MIGFDNLAIKLAHMNRGDIRRCVGRARRLRGQQLAAWAQRVAQTWASLFRYQRRLLPTDGRSRDRMMHATKL